MEKQYLDYNGLQDVAGHVNTRLKTVTTMPVSADNGAVRLYVGNTTETYIQGHIYQYNVTNLEWVDITDDNNIVKGYFNSTDNLFYEESTYTTPIVGKTNVIYISLDTNLLYRYNSSIFIRVDEIIIDNALSDTSENPVQNKIINDALSGKTDKVISATNGNLASLDSNGNLSDSGIASTNVVVKSITSGLVKNDGTIDTAITGAVSANTTAINGIKDGTSIDSFSDVETALIDKADMKSVFKNIETGTTASKGYIKGALIWIEKLTTEAGGHLFKVTANTVSQGDTWSEIKSSKLQETSVTGEEWSLLQSIILKADKASSATDGDVAKLDSNGNLVDSGIAATDLVIKSSTAGLLKNDGTVDTNTYLTEDDIADKADKVISAINGDLAGLDSNGNLTDSGILATDVIVKSSTNGLVKNDGSIDTNTYLTSSDISDKADKVSSATNGDLAGLDSNGNLTDSGIASTNVVVKSSTSGLLKNDGTVDTNSYATVSALNNKADKVTSATANDFATLDVNGNLTDSGINKNIIPNGATSSNKLATANDIPTELNDLSDDVVITNPVNAQILAYNSTSQKWENQTGQAVIGGTVFKGSILFANLPTTGMINGDWYDIKDAFVTDSTFEEGAGISCAAGTDVIWVADDNKWNILTPSGVYSFNGRTGAISPQSGDYSKSDVGLGNVVNTGDSATPVSGGTTKFTTGGAYTELNKKADKVTGTFTSGNFASLNSSGNIADSGKKASDFATDNQTFTQASTRANIVSGESFSTIFGKIMKWFADLKDLAFIGKDGTSSTKYLRGDGTWQAFPSIPSAYTSNPQMDGTASAGTSSNYAKGDHRHPSDTTKADKVTGTFTSGNFAGLDANGNITDSGSKASDFSTVKTRQTPVSGGTDLSLVNTGDMYTWNNKTNTSVKGDAESSYRTGQVNITPANIGLGNVGNFKAVSTVASQGLTDTEKANARANIGAGTSSFSGSYNDLSNKPTIPAAQVNSDWNATSGVAQILNKPTIPSITNCYQTDDTAETALADGDYFPFYDTSATAKRKTLWSNIKSVLKTYFDTLYSTVKTRGTPTSGGTMLSLVNTGDMYTWNNKADNSVVSTSANGLAPKVTDTGKYLRGDGTWATPTNTWTAMVGATSSANGSVGYVNAVPPKDGYNTKYLRADGTWTVPPDNNTWTAMVGATSSANGSVGYVNAVPPKDGYNTKYLRADGSWQVPPNTTYESKAAASGGTDVSLCTTGEKYTWDNKSDAVSVTRTGNAYSYEFSEQVVRVGNTDYGINGSLYMQATGTLNANSTTTFTFEGTNSVLNTANPIEVFIGRSGTNEASNIVNCFQYTQIVTTAKNSQSNYIIVTVAPIGTAVAVTVRVYIRRGGT